MPRRVLYSQDSNFGRNYFRFIWNYFKLNGLKLISVPPIECQKRHFLHVLKLKRSVTSQQINGMSHRFFFFHFTLITKTLVQADIEHEHLINWSLFQWAVNRFMTNASFSRSKFLVNFVAFVVIFSNTGLSNTQKM